MTKVVFETVQLTMGPAARTALAGWSPLLQNLAEREAEALCREEMGGIAEMSEEANFGGTRRRNGFLIVFQAWPTMFHIEKIQLLVTPIGEDRSFYILADGRGLVERPAPDREPVARLDPEVPDAYARAEACHNRDTKVEPGSVSDAAPLQLSFSACASQELARLSVEQRCIALQDITRAASEAAPVLPGDTGVPLDGAGHLFLGCATRQLGFAFLIEKKAGAFHVHRLSAVRLSE